MNRADRLEQAHRRAVGELAGWRCREEDAAGVECTVTGLTEGDPGAELLAHYLEAHPRPAPTSRR